MTPDTMIELALYRVSDRLKSNLHHARFPNLDAAISAALRQVGEEIAKIGKVATPEPRPIVHIGVCGHGVSLATECDACATEALATARVREGG